jgi:hypothetical protein
MKNGEPIKGLRIDQAGEGRILSHANSINQINNYQNQMQEYINNQNAEINNNLINSSSGQNVEDNENQMEENIQNRNGQIQGDLNSTIRINLNRIDNSREIDMDE